MLTSFKSSNSWWFAGPQARPPHRATLRKRPGDGFESERTFFDSKCLLTSFKSLNSWWFAGPQARPPHRSTLRKHSGTVFVRHPLRDAPAPLPCFKRSNMLWFADPTARPPDRATLRKRPGSGFDSEGAIFRSKWSPKPSPELPGCLRKTSADLPLARPETRAAPGRCSAPGPLTFPSENDHFLVLLSTPPSPPPPAPRHGLRPPT